MKKSYKGILLFLMILAIITLSFSFVSASENVTSDVILDDVSSQGEIDEIDDGYDDSAEQESSKIQSKFEVKNVVKLLSILYCKIVPSISSLDHDVLFSAPISSINKISLVIISSNTSL